jgi:hypothetical protein
LFNHDHATLTGIDRFTPFFGVDSNVFAAKVNEETIFLSFDFYFFVGLFFAVYLNMIDKLALKTQRNCEFGR